MSNYIDKAWAENGDKTDIPVNAQVDGSVSYDQGFTELYERNVATDPTAIPLSRTKFNFEKNKITANLKQWLDQCYPDYYEFDNLGNPVEYKIYSAVRYNDGVYLSKVNNNTALPTDDTKWSLFQTLDFASEAEAIARTDTNKWMNPFVSGKLIDNELIGNIPKSAIDLGTTDLNTLSSSSDAGIYYQGSDANTAGNHYPVNYSGTLILTRSAEITHTYIVYSSAGMGNANKIFTRGYYSGSWSSWKDISGGTDTLNPVGSGIISYDGEVFNGYIPAEGQAVSRSLYPLLFAKWGTKYGAGDGSTTFNVIDMRNLFIRGKGSLSNDYNITQQDCIRPITGSVTMVTDSNNNGIVNSASGAFNTTGVSRVKNMIVGGSGSRFSGFNLNVGNQVPTADENRPINMAVRYLIKAS